MDILVQTVIDGLVLGSGYTLLALGFALVYSVSGVLNVAHAEFYMLGAYAAVFANSWWGGGLVVALLAGVVAAALGGFILHVTVLRRFTTEQHLPAFLATIGFAMFMQFGLARIVSSRQRLFPDLFRNTYHSIGPATISNKQLLVWAATAGLVIALVRWINHSRMGREIRATAESEQAAAILGIRTSRVKLVSLVVATGMAGVAGVLLGHLFGAVSPFMGSLISLKMFVVVLVSGIGSISGPVVTGLALGVIESLTVAYVGSIWQQVAGMVALVIVLLWRPSGLFGRSVRTG